MQELVKKLSKISLIAILCFHIIGIIFIFASPEMAQAQDDGKKGPTLTVILQTPIGTRTDFPINDKSLKPIAEYINLLYKYAVGAVGIIASVVLMMGGVIWLTAGGNTDKISEAKAWISSSLTGLVLVSTSYLILSQVNPDLVELKIPDIEDVDTKPDGKDKKISKSNASCDWQTVVPQNNNQCISFNIDNPNEKSIEKPGFCIEKNKQDGQKCCCVEGEDDYTGCEWDVVLAKCDAKKQSIKENMISVCGNNVPEIEHEYETVLCCCDK